MSKSVMLLLSVTLFIGVTHANHGKHSHHHHDHGHDHEHDHAEAPTPAPLTAASPDSNVAAAFPGGSFFQVWIVSFQSWSYK